MASTISRYPSASSYMLTIEPPRWLSTTSVYTYTHACYCKFWEGETLFTLTIPRGYLIMILELVVNNDRINNSWYFLFYQNIAEAIKTWQMSLLKPQHYPICLTVNIQQHFSTTMSFITSVAYIHRTYVCGPQSSDIRGQQLKPF